MPKEKKLGSNCKEDNDCKNKNCVEDKCVRKDKGVSRSRKSNITNEMGSAFTTTGDFLGNVGKGTTSALTGLTSSVASYMPSFSSSQNDDDDTESIPESVPEELADMIREGSITILMINDERYYMNPGNDIIYNEQGDVVGEQLESGETSLSANPEISSFNTVSPNTAIAASSLASLSNAAYNTYDKYKDTEPDSMSLYDKYKDTEPDSMSLYDKDTEDGNNSFNSILDEEPINAPDSGSGETMIIGSDTTDSNRQKYSDETPSPQYPEFDNSTDPSDYPDNENTVSPLDFTDNTMNESTKFGSSTEDDLNRLPSSYMDELDESPNTPKNRGGKSRRKYKKVTKKHKGRKNKNTRRKKRGSRRR